MPSSSEPSTQVRGAALWVLGSEDEGIWTFYDRHLPALPQAAALRRMSSSADFDFAGEGEILSVAAEASEGLRDLEWDARHGVFSREIYRQFATPLILQRQHRREHTLALTFDDGPDPRFTPKVLDCLDRLGAPAS